MTILILGHKGMLGHMIHKYFLHLNLCVETIDYRWPSEEFKDAIKNSNADYLINCIAAIPQKSYEDYSNLNIKLPIWIAKNFKGKIIHPATDGEFCGDIPISELYDRNTPRDAYDDYGLSKACVGAILADYTNVKQLRTSINGPELNNGVTLYSWFRNQTDVVNCIDNHYWSGITTLEWAKNAFYIISNWEKYPNITQLSTECITKMELLSTINDVFNLNKKLIPVSSTNTINRCLKSDYMLPTLKEQFIELKEFYYGI